MTMIKKLAAVLGIAGALCVPLASAEAGDYGGNFMVKAGVTGVLPDSSFGPITANGAPFLGAGNAEVEDKIIPSLTLAYFLNKNIAVELFCCFSKHDIDGKSALAGVDVGSSWIFPPALTVQYHFDGMGAIKPYVGVGLQYINFFSSKSDDLGGSLKIDDAVGFTVQAGVDFQLGGGWYAGLDVKKTWLDSDYRLTTGAGAVLRGDFDLDPLIVTANIGYRFNLSDLFGRREVAPLK